MRETRQAASRPYAVFRSSDGNVIKPSAKQAWASVHEHAAAVDAVGAAALARDARANEREARKRAREADEAERERAKRAREERKRARDAGADERDAADRASAGGAGAGGTSLRSVRARTRCDRKREREDGESGGCTWNVRLARGGFAPPCECPCAVCGALRRDLCARRWLFRALASASARDGPVRMNE